MRRVLLPLVPALLVLCARTTAADVIPLDLEALIQSTCGDSGYAWNNGCVVELGRGVFEIGPTTIGACDGAGSNRIGLTLRGQGTSPFASRPRFPTAPTTLVYRSDLGGPSAAMLKLCGTPRLVVEDMAIDALGARVGIQLSADNLASSISHFVTLEDLTILGAAVGIELTGENYNDQTDFVTINRVSIQDAKVGVRQDSQQNQLVKLTTVEVVSSAAGIELKGGSLVCENCYMGTSRHATSSYKAFHATRSARPGFSHHSLDILHGHFEIETGSAIVADAGADFPIRTVGNSFQMQCAGCNEMVIADVDTTAPLTMLGDHIQSTNNSARMRICSRSSPLVTLGVYAKKETGGIVRGCD